MEGLGLALGGGGITGCSHVGVICALEEQGIPIHYITGTSAGGMVAALYASGNNGRRLAKMVPELTKKILDYDYWGVLRGLLHKTSPFPGMIRGKRLRRYLESAIGDKSLRDMDLPIAITSCDIQSSKQVLFAGKPLQTLYLGADVEVVRDAKAVDAVIASMSIPGLFRPVRMGNRVLVDGGLMDNCPTAALKALGARRLIAVNLVSINPMYPKQWSLSSIVSRSLSLGLYRLSESDACYADMVLNPDVGTIGLLDFSCISLCVEKGYDHAKKHMDQILRLVETPVKAAETSFPYPVPAPLEHTTAHGDSFVH